MTDKSHDDLMRPDGEVNPIDTDYQVGQDNIALQFGPLGLDIHNRVFLISGSMIALFVVITLLFKNDVGPLFSELKNSLTAQLDWFFIGTSNLFVVLCLCLVLSPLGRVRLGGTEATPDYSYVEWFSMLFAAGMGIGLMFYGVAEPLSHYSSALGGVAEVDGIRSDWAPLGGALGDSGNAKDLGMAATIYHWGLHPWSIYALLALSLALFSFNKGLPLTMRSIFYPIFGERIWGWPGHIIDITAVVATLFGLATSLGFGASQATAGLHFLFGIPGGITTQVILIILITGFALTSVVAGLDSGVKLLSEFNMFWPPCSCCLSLRWGRRFLFFPIFSPIWCLILNICLLCPCLLVEKMQIIHKVGLHFIWRGGCLGLLLWGCLSLAFLEEERYENSLFASF